MAVTSFYKRTLPCPPAVEFDSPAGKKLFSEAFEDGTMEGFFSLISYFQTQAEPAYCGLASLCVVLNALSIDPGRTWKGPWRWYDESMLDCCETLEKVRQEGITFAKVACLAKCAGASVRTYRATKSTLEEFRCYTKQCASSNDQHIIVSYSRQPLGQTGIGHFSPIGGYNSKTDMVLILDVARFKYPPHWVPLPLLWEAMNTIDTATGKSRGYLLVSKRKSGSSALFTLSCKDNQWKAMSLYLVETVANILKSAEVKSVQEAISLVLSLMPMDVSSFVSWMAEVKIIEKMDSGELSPDEAERIKRKSYVLERLRTTKIYKIINELLDSRAEDGSKAALEETICEACTNGSSFLRSLCCNINVIATMRADDSGVPSPLDSRISETHASEHRLDVLVPTAPKQIPSCSCKQEGIITLADCWRLYPASMDLLTILLLALPTESWEGIVEPDLRTELSLLVSHAALSSDLREEVQHLREQLQVISIFCQGNVEDNLDVLMKDRQNDFGI